MSKDIQDSVPSPPRDLVHQSSPDPEILRQDNAHSKDDTSTSKEQDTGKLDGNFEATTISRNRSLDTDNDPYALRPRKHDGKQQSLPQWKQPRGQRKIKK
jgi:hypothetical protein